MTFLGQKLKKKGKTTLALCIKCLPKTVISIIMCVKDTSQNLSPLNDTTSKLTIYLIQEMFIYIFSIQKVFSLMKHFSFSNIIF